MNPITNFCDFINNKYSVAMEADDITGDVKDAANDSVGNDQNNDGDLDTDTNDILGLKEDTTNDNTDEDDTTRDNPDTNTEDTQQKEDDTEEDEMNENDTMGGEDTPQEDDAKEENPFAESRKKKIKQQYIHLYDVLDDTIKLVFSYVPNITNEDTVKVLNTVNNNLVQCRTQIYSIITEEYHKLEYHELLKKYVALNRIYDLSLKTIENYFDIYNADGSLKKNISKK